MGGRSLGLGAVKPPLGTPAALGGAAGLAPRATAGVRPPRGETLSLAQEVPESERTPAPELTGPTAPVLGRGSAAAFPPVTAERTLPAVPPFHGASSGLLGSDVGSTTSGQSDESIHETATRPQNDVPIRTEAVDTPLAAAQVALDSDARAGATPRLADSGDQAPVSHAVDAWSVGVNASVDDGGAPDTRDVAVAATSEEARPALVADQRAFHQVGVTLATPASALDDDLDFGLKPKLEARRVVSFAVAGVVALLFGASGFASGYLLGVSKAPVPSRSVAATGLEASDVARSEPLRQPLPPPPPPPPLGIAEGEAVAAGLPDVKPPVSKSDESKSKKSTERKSDEVNALAAPEPAAAGEGARADSLSALGMSAGSGPIAGPGSNQVAASGPGLEAAAIQSTVQKNQNAVKRSCWQPALNNRSADAPSTARVTTTIHIAPNGKVTHVKHSGDPRGYPGLGACITTRLKGWTFPKSNGSTTANIPFVFAAQ